MTLVFLDFDGVLRRETAPSARLEADCVGNIESTVLAHPHVRVVISSAWRVGYPLDALRSLFSAEFAARIDGVTPEFIEAGEYTRHAEVQAYLEANGIEDARWIAIDDDPWHFQPNAPLILVDPFRGFDADYARELAAWLAQ